MGKYGHNSVHMGENTDQRKPVFRHISHSFLLKIYSHNLDLRENKIFVSARKLFVREYRNRFPARKIQARK